MFFFYAIILKVKQGNQQLLIQSERKLRRGGPAKIELARSGEGGARDLLGVEAERADKRAVLTFGKSSWDCLRSKVVSEPRLVLHLFCFCPLILHFVVFIFIFIYRRRSTREGSRWTSRWRWVLLYILLFACWRNHWITIL